MRVFSLRRGRRLDPRLKMAVVLIFYLELPQFEQSEAPRFVFADFLVLLVLPQFLQFDCFISLPPAFMV